MTRQATKRPPSEHHATLTRIFRQVSVDKKMIDERRQRILKHLKLVLNELEEEMTK